MKERRPSSKKSDPDPEPGKRERDVEDFRGLSFRILHLANRGLHTADFLREVSRMLLDFSGCDALEIWSRARGRCQHYSGTTSRVLGFESKVCFEMGGPLRICRDALGSALGAHLAPAVEDCLFARELVPSFLRLGCSSSPPDPQAAADRGADSPFPSVALLPFSVDEEERGLLVLKSRLVDRFPPRDMELFRSLAQRIGIALASQRAQAALKERVKELTCLYSVSRLCEQPDNSLDQILQGVVELLPQAWQFPEVASAHVEVDGRAFRSASFRESGQIQRAPIVVHGKGRGVVEVQYHETRPDLDEGPFLVEERSLIDTVARQIALVLERRKASEERERLEQQLRHADRLATIGTLAAGVAHELNEPLGSILGFAELAQQSRGVPRGVRDDLAKIVAASLHARDVIKKLMLFSRPTPPRGVPVDLNLLVKDGLVFLESRCSKEKIELVRRLVPDLPLVTADPSQLQQVLVNLVVNSIQAMPRGGRLTIATDCNEDSVSLIVEDTGTGMSQEVMARAFLPFFTTKEVGQGTGLGLAVVHGIVASHGGLVTIESKAGKGSRFEVMLPRRAPLCPVAETTAHDH